MNQNDISIGDTINNCTVIDIYLNSKPNLMVKAKCNECGLLLNIPGYKFRRGHFLCKHGERRKPEYYIGTQIGRLYIEGIHGKDSSNRTIVNVVCTECESRYNVQLYKVTNFSFLCECEKLNKYDNLMVSKYKTYIGMSKLSDTIVDVVYRPEASAGSNRAKFVLHCNDCGLNREVGVIQFLDSDNYKKCNCKPKTREVIDPMKKYNQTLLNKRFGNLVIKDFIAGNTLQNTYAVCDCDCGNKEFITAIGNIVSGDTRSCGCKYRSNASIVIENELKRLGIKFIMEKSLPDLISIKGRPLRFDFFILNNNNDGVAIIEYDGPHHQIPFDYRGNWEDQDKLNSAFRTIQANDKIKDEYAKANNLLMLRINYNYKQTDNDIRRIVDKFISDNKLV